MFSEDVKKVFDLAVTQHNPSLFYSSMKLCLGVDQQWRIFFSTMCLSRIQFLKWKTICARVFVVFSQSAMPFQDNGLFNEVFLHATQVAALRVATRSSLRLTTQGGLGASGLKLMRGPDLYCLWKHRDKRWKRGSGRLGEEEVVSLRWYLRFNRWTTAAVMDVEKHQIIIAGVSLHSQAQWTQKHSGKTGFTLLLCPL